jgi:hypothetical protein
MNQFLLSFSQQGAILVFPVLKRYTDKICGDLKLKLYEPLS